MKFVQAARIVAMGCWPVALGAALALSGCRAGNKQPAKPPAPAAGAPQPAPATEPPPAPAPVPSPAPAAPAPDPLTWRPGWWTDSAIATPDSMSIAAMAEDADLSLARRKAVDAAMSGLRTAIGREPAGATTKVDSIKLPDGRYRAFVLATAGLR